MKGHSALVIYVLVLGGCQTDLQHEVSDYMTRYADKMQGLYYESSEAEWASNTHIVEGDTTNSVRTRRANEALAAFVGSPENIERIRHFLDNSERLTTLQVRQLEAMLYAAANQPGTEPEVVAERFEMTAALTT